MLTARHLSLPRQGCSSRLGGGPRPCSLGVEGVLSHQVSWDGVGEWRTELGQPSPD